MTARTWLRRWRRRAARVLDTWRKVAMVLATAFVEKNLLKTAGLLHVPVVISMSRVIDVAFAAVLLRWIASNGVTGWPMATLCIAVVLAIPVVARLDRLPPDRAVDLMERVIGRFGVGAVGRASRARAAFAAEPSKFDDHRQDRLALC